MEPAQSAGAARIPAVVPRLRSLDLGHTAVGDGGVTAIVTRATVLRQLQLGDAGLGRAGSRAILASPLAPTLRELDVAQNALLNATDLRRLATGPFDAMARLDVGGLLEEDDPIFEDGWRYVGHSRSEVYERKLEPSGAPLPFAAATKHPGARRPATRTTAPIAYIAGRSYTTGEVIAHPTLGEGVVQDVAGSRIVVKFDRGLKVLPNGG